MKNTLKSILALAMVICMLFTIAGCGDKGKDTSSDADNTNDAFFAETETQDAENNSAVESTGTQSNAQSGTQSSGDTTNGGSVTTTVPKENQVGGKSWKEVLSTMPKKLRGTTLIMYNWNTADSYTGAPAVMDAFKKQTGIKVEWRTIGYTSYFTKLPSLIASGENIPDMARFRGAELDFMQSFQPLSVAKFDFTDEAWDSTIMKQFTFNGKTYAATLQNTHVSGAFMLFYNKALINKHGYEDPYKLWKAGKWNWDKYIEMCEQAKDDGYLAGSCGEGFMPAYAATWGITNMSYNGKKIVSNWNSKDFLKVHQTLGKLYNEKYVLRFAGEDCFNALQTVFTTGSAIHLRNKNSYFGEIKASKNLYAVPIPEHKELKGEYYQAFSELEVYGIPKGASNPEAVPYFLRYFLDGANYQLDTYFGNKQNLEVYNWCMNQKNKVISYGYAPADIAQGNGSIQNNTSAQMKSFIDANKGKNQEYLDELNKLLNKLK